MPLFLNDGAMHYFAHIPKAGGSSVERFIAETLGTPFLINDRYWSRRAVERWTRTSPQHILWSDLVTMVPEALIASAFAVTRHPVARAASAFNYRVARAEIPVGQSFEAWFERGARAYARNGFIYDNHLVPQHRFVPEDAATWRLEDGLGHALAAIARRFGAAPPADGVLENPTPKGPSPLVARTEPMARRTKDELAEFYRDDFHRFDYDPRMDVEIPLFVPARATAAATLRSRLRAQTERMEAAAIRSGGRWLHDFR